MIDKQAWIDWLKLKGLSEKTLQDYGGYFDKLNLENISPDYLEKFLRSYNNGVSRAMLKNLLQFIRINSEVPLEIKERVSEFEIPRITGRRKQKALKILTRSQVHELAQKVRNTRDRYMILTTFYLGLRSVELLSLRIDSFNWKNGEVKVVGKGKRERILPMIPQLQDKLIEYINNCIEKYEEFDFIFPVTSRHWRGQLRRYGRKYLGFPVNPHLLRHSCGTFLHSQGLDLKEIADFLGHASINTTQIYTHLDKRQLKARVLNALS